MTHIQRTFRRRVDVSPSLNGQMTSSGETIRLEGGRTGISDVFTVVNDDVVVAGHDLAAVVSRGFDRGNRIPINRFALAMLLHNALVPVPDTVYADVNRLSMGDSIQVPLYAHGIPTLSHSYPWDPSLSTGTSVPDPRRLLDQLTASTDRDVAKFGSNGILMLSSGKDSVAVAVSLAEAGYTDVECVTFTPGGDDPEPEIARAVCDRLGLPHTVAEVPTDPDIVRDRLIRFFQNAPEPGTDLSQIPYVLIVGGMGHADFVMEGGGNDPYMGYPPVGTDAKKTRFRLRGKRAVKLAQRLVPVDSPLNYLARSRVEATFPGRTLRYRHVRRLLPGVDNPSDLWFSISRDVRNMDEFLMFAAVNERHTNANQTMRKQHLATTAFGTELSAPWADEAIAEYYFNLPQAEKYDLETGRNKILLRRMLAEALDYDADAVGKHYFLFDGARFVSEHAEFIRDEVDVSPLWDDAGRRMVHGWIDRIDDRPLLYHAILTVLMVSGWSNHCRLLRNVDGTHRLHLTDDRPAYA